MLFLFFLFASSFFGETTKTYVAKDWATVRYLDNLGLKRASPGVFEGELSKESLRNANVEISNQANDETYKGYSTDRAILKDMNSYAQITKGEVRVIGKSYRERDILALRLGEYKSGRPTVLLAAGIHGNEIVGAELLMMFAKHLIYESEGILYNFVNIWIVPRINPDGYSMKQRENYNGVDLNRDYDHDREGAQPETNAMRDFMDSIHPHAVAVLHGGATVCSFPLDSRDDHMNHLYSASPDDDLLRDVCAQWASKNPDMNENPLFKSDGGIINGNKWYELLGGLQDWAYWRGVAVSITPEIAPKYPSYNSVTSRYFPNNLGSIDKFVRMSMQGVHGRVMDSKRNFPLEAVIKTDGVDVTANADGYYWRILSPGEHEIIVSVPGYTSARFTVNIKADQSYQHDLQLVRS